MDLVISSGRSAHDEYVVDIDPTQAGWTYCGLKVLTLDAATTVVLDTADQEYLVLPLAGSCTVDLDGQCYPLCGRADVFSAVTDYLYVPRRTTVRISAAAPARIALPNARSAADLPVQYASADTVRIELRGAGHASRQVNNYALANDLQTDRLLVCEVLTPDGNTSSYPPHKHDVHTEVERELEEMYYFEIGGGATGFGLQRCYGTTGRPLDVCCEVRTGDVVLIPHGYHGPSVALPGYPMYYLNVMAGPAPDGRWLMTDDPAHSWVRQQWPHQSIDPRLPMTGSR